MCTATLQKELGLGLDLYFGLGSELGSDLHFAVRVSVLQSAFMHERVRVR